MQKEHANSYLQYHTSDITVKVIPRTIRNCRDGYMLFLFLQMCNYKCLISELRESSILAILIYI
jgi:hypothetical protein